MPKPTTNAASKTLERSERPEFDVAEHVAFLLSFLRQPVHVGALSPSSRTLSRAIVEGLALRAADTVVELGPGTGAFTELIRRRMGRDTTLLTLEVDRAHALTLQRRYPDVHTYHDSAERLLDYLARHGKTSADYIVSGLPWANLRTATQTRIMDAIVAALAPEGTFTTFAYAHARWLPKARHFRANLARRFAVVETTPVVWRNLPPAFVYRCGRARPGA